MQREIKFRAFDKEAKTMHKVSSIYFDNKQVFIQEKFFDVWLDLNDVELMQFTGLYDKNDKEIYEGDIIRISLITSEKSAVTYEKGGFYVKTKNGNYRLGNWEKESLEIIGNIHENPELLK